MPILKPAVLTALAAALGAVPLQAQAHKGSLYDKFQINLSATSVILNSNIRVDGKNGTGTDIDAEDDLGMEKTKLQPRGSLRWRPGRRHELEVGYQFARRSSHKTLEREIEFGDSTYDVGAEINSVFNTDQAALTYRFAFTAKERTQIGAALGLGAIFLDVGIDAQGAAGGKTGDVAGQKSATGPLGSLGLYGRFLAGDRWFFELDARGVKISIDRFDVGVIEGGGAARYYFSPSFAMDLGYSASAIKVDIGPKEFESGATGIISGRVKYSLQSIRLGVVIVP